MFTKKEKNIILVITLILLSGALWSLVRTAFRKQEPISAGDVSIESAFDRENESVAEAELPPQPIDINSAGLLDFEALPYIGMSKARDIINYREEHGAFRTLEDLTKIKGIGPATLEKIKPYLMIQQ